MWEGPLQGGSPLHEEAAPWEEPAMQGPPSRKSSLCTGEPPALHCSLQMASWLSEV